MKKEGEDGSVSAFIKEFAQGTCGYTSEISVRSCVNFQALPTCDDWTLWCVSALLTLDRSLKVDSGEFRPLQLCKMWDSSALGKFSLTWRINCPISERAADTAKFLGEFWVDLWFPLKLLGNCTYFPVAFHTNSRRIWSWTQDSFQLYVHTCTSSAMKFVPKGFLVLLCSAQRKMYNLSFQELICLLEHCKNFILWETSSFVRGKRKTSFCLALCRNLLNYEAS